MVELFNIEMTVQDKILYDKKDYVILVDSQIGNSNITNLFFMKIVWLSTIMK